MTNRIVRISLERDVRISSRHPHIERVMHEQIRQQGTDYSSLRRPRRTRHDAAILHLHRRLQPAFDVEQNPSAIRMLADRLEHQLPINTVEGRYDRLPTSCMSQNQW